ncbi:MAG: hypothetical protein K1X55_03635 [Chitinophagales bacterium]|nr:hypothetical protein [Chitinophagales bacterium]
MKKITISGVALMLMLSLTSCKKDYTCSCSLGGVELEKIQYKDMKKSEAQDKCDEKNDIAVLVGGSCSLD